MLVACALFTRLALLFVLVAAGSERLTLTEVGVPIALFSAVAGFLFNSAVKLHSEARDCAFEFVKQHSEQKELDAAFVRLRRFKQSTGAISEEVVIDLLTELLSDPMPKSALPGSGPAGESAPEPGVIESVLKIGNFFELMEIAIRQGSVQEAMVRDYYRAMLHRYAALAAPFIAVFRDDPPRPGSPVGDAKRPRTLIGVDALVARWPLPPEYR